MQRTRVLAPCLKLCPTTGIILAIFSSPVAIFSATIEGNTISFFSGGHQPLHAASSQGHLLVVRALLACESDVNAKSK